MSTTVGVVQGISHKHCSVLHRADGYLYLLKQALLSALKNRVSAPRRFHELDIMILLAGKKKVLIQSRIMVAQSQRRHSWN